MFISCKIFIFTVYCSLHGSFVFIVFPHFLFIYLVSFLFSSTHFNISPVPNIFITYFPFLSTTPHDTKHTTTHCTKHLTPHHTAELVEVLLSKVLLCESNTKKRESSTKNQDSRTNSPTSETFAITNSSSHDNDNNKSSISNNDKNNNNNNDDNNNDNDDNDGGKDSKTSIEKNENLTSKDTSLGKTPELPVNPRDFDPHSTLHIVRQSMQDQPPKLIFSVCQALGSVGYVFLSEYVRGQNRKPWGNGNGVVDERNERKCVQCVQQITVILIAMLRHGVVKVRIVVCACVCVCVCVYMCVCCLRCVYKCVCICVCVLCEVCV
jgi:hypothetical protein